MKTADIVVIGGGIIGCSTAYNLAKHGGRNVVLLERKSVCSGGTAKSCAICRTHYSVRANLIHAGESLKILLARQTDGATYGPIGTASGSTRCFCQYRSQPPLSSNVRKAARASLVSS
ncbi:MAG: FAD-dependent oxidoreductase, partial [Chloroflexi bacterium]|nr:FAD-dependent oxidoreductase [Chloroflexota bacterium]